MVSVWKQQPNNQPTHLNSVFTRGFPANWLSHPNIPLRSARKRRRREKERANEGVNRSSPPEDDCYWIELICILMQPQGWTIPICTYLLLTAFDKHTDKGSDSIQGEQNNWRVLKQITFNWCLHQAPGDRLPGSSPLWDEGNRIHFSLGEWEINDPEMDLCEMRYEPGPPRTLTDSWLTGVNCQGGPTGLKVQDWPSRTLTPNISRNLRLKCYILRACRPLSDFYI